MNPVLLKDVLGLLRLKRIALIQVAFVLVLAALVLGTWPQQGVMSLAAQQQDRLQAGLLVGQLLLLILFVPGVASVGLTSEREGATMEMLYASRLKPIEIVVGKLGAALTFPLLLLVTGLPFLGLLYYRGGEIDSASFLRAYLVLLLGAVLLATLALAVSALSRQTSTALVVSYLLALVLSLGTMVPALIMLDTQQGAIAEALHYLRCTSPVAALLSVLRPGYNDLGGFQRHFIPAWQGFIVFAAVGIAVSVGIVVAILSRPPIQPERATSPVKKRTIARRILFLIDPERQRKPIGRLNPLLSKESRTNALRSGRWMVRIFYGSLVLAGGLALMSLYGGSEYGDLLDYVVRILVGLQIGMVAMISPSLTTPAISAELESGTFETLRMSRLSGGQIFWGKFLPAFVPALLPVIALAPAFGTLCYIDNAMIAVLYKLLPLVAASVAMSCAIGLMCSSITSNTARATVIAYAVVAGIVLLPALAWLASGEQLDPRSARWLALPSPLVMALNLLPSGSPLYRQLYVQHLLTVLGIALLALVVARVRLWQLLHRG